ncbi:MAG: hypothetical protein CHACPFDD_02805 [Phycisphaerae bacterium]|nr:hypothetical protein [Phycisphaerae bacterium]
MTPDADCKIADARRVGLMRARWLTLSACGLVGGVGAWTVLPLASKAAIPLLERLAELGSVAAFAVLLLLAVAGCFFTGDHQNELLPGAQRIELRRILQETTTATFSGSGAAARLEQALNGGSWWQVRWIFGDAPRDVCGWATFSDVLVELTEIRPGVGIPLIAPLLTEVNGEPTIDPSRQIREELVVRFLPDEARRLFDYDRLLRAVGSSDAPPGLETELNARCRAVIEWARSESELARDPGEPIAAARPQTT